MSQYVKVEVESVVRCTDKSALLKVGGKDFWVPWSQLDDSCCEGPVASRFSGPLRVARWVCEVEGIPCSEE